MDAKTLKLLLVEDDKLLGKILIRSLAQHCRSVTWAKSVKAGLIELASYNYDAVLLDWDGLREAVRIVERAMIPVVIHTGNSHTCSASADARVVIKPASVEEIINGLLDEVGKGKKQ